MIAHMTPAMILHIGGGSVGLLSGAAALSVRKGERLHRAFGTVFLVSMLLMSAMAIYLAVTIPGQGSNAFGGIFTFYLITTAWLTARRKDIGTSLFDKVVLIIPLGIAVLCLIGGFEAESHPPPAGAAPVFATFIFAGVAALAAATDLKVILQGGISGAQRIARHVWRMSVGFFVATGSFFIGKQQDMPQFVRGSPILTVLAFAPLALMFVWLARVQFTNQFGNRVTASQGVLTRLMR